MKVKKLLAAILAVAMVLGMMAFPAFADEAEDLNETPEAYALSAGRSASVWSGEADTTWYTDAEEGTTDFIISTSEQLAGLAEIVNGTTGTVKRDDFTGKTITLSNDINLELLLPPDETEVEDPFARAAVSTEWKPIGKYNKLFNKYFCGTFDGAGFEISGLEISEATTGEFLALFGAIKNATIKNLTVSGSVRGKNVAGIVARMDGGSIINCVNKVDVTAVGETKNGGIACLAGATSDISVIEGCKNVGAITIEGETVAGAAGIISYISNKGQVEVKNCVNEGTVSNGTYSGGIVSYAMGGSSCIISGCENTGAVTTLKSAGGIIGFVGNDPVKKRIIENCTNSGQITGATACGIAGVTQNVVSINNSNTGELIGNNTYEISGGNGVSTAVAKIGDTYYSDLQAAFDEAAEGAVVELFSGVCEEAIVMPLKSITLKGGDNTLLKGGIEFAHGTVPQGIQITIEGLSFEGKGIKLVGWGATDLIGNAQTLTIRNNKFNNIQGEKNIYAIHINNADDAIAGLSIIDNEFNNNQTGAFCATVRGEVVIEGNKIMNSGMNGGTLNFIDDTGNAATSVQIKDNQFIEWGLNKNDAGNYEGRALRLSKFADGSVVDITNNVFLCTNPPEEHIKATGINDGSTVTLNENYWGTEKPDFDAMLNTEGKINVTSYYQTFTEDGTLADLLAVPEDLTEVTKKIELEVVEDTNMINVYITGADENGTPAIVENLVAVDLALEITKGVFDIADVTIPAELKDKWDISVVGENRYLIKEIGVNQEDMEDPSEGLGNANNDLDGQQIHIATIILGGYGSGTLKAVGGDGTNDVAQRTKNDNIVLSSNLAETAVDFDIAAATNDLTVNVSFPNNIVDNAAAYQQMKATISGGDLTQDIVVEFGGELADNAYTFTQELTQNITYTVTIEGEGYRTARCSVNMNADKVLNFWNNVKDTAEANGERKNFLAGEIVKDGKINVYDLSAVVSYFGENNLVEDHPEYAKYDLNRDGKIDSKDVAMVLVSWGN